MRYKATFIMAAGSGLPSQALLQAVHDQPEFVGSAVVSELPGAPFALLETEVDAASDERAMVDALRGYQRALDAVGLSICPGRRPTLQIRP